MQSIKQALLTVPAVPSVVASRLSRSLLGRFKELLGGLQHGVLTITWPDGSESHHGTSGRQSMIVLHNYAPIRALASGGHVGFAESYIKGDWSTDDIVTLFEFIANNQTVIEKHIKGSRWSRIRNMVTHSMSRNSIKGSRRNIASHYDLGNDFYQLWLDESMTYSSAVYDESTESLGAAQRNKMALVADLLKPSEGQEVLEIGCGWGALSHYLADEKKCHVHGVSLSNRQLEIANSRVDSRPNDSGRLRFSYTDYRQLEGSYDHIVSIEMFEAVGIEYWNTYFEKLNQLLRTGGRVVLQVITIADSRFENYRRNPDFIQRYIFPGGMLPTCGLLTEKIEAAGFSLQSARWIGDSYATTLREWRSQFESRLAEVKSLGYDDRFIRMWRYYLAYCEAGFLTGGTDVGVLLLQKR